MQYQLSNLLAKRMVTDMLVECNAAEYATRLPTTQSAPCVLQALLAPSQASVAAQASFACRWTHR